MNANVSVYDFVAWLKIIVCKLMLLFFHCGIFPKGKIISNELYTLLCVVFFIILVVSNYTQLSIFQEKGKTN